MTDPSNTSGYPTPQSNDIVVGSMDDNDSDKTEDNEGTIRIDHHQ